jgi:hypothetical protein
LNEIVSAPAAAFASATAWASEPAPDGPVLVTVKVAASAAPAAPESERPRMKRTAVFMALLSRLCRRHGSPNVLTRNVAIWPRFALVSGQ